MTANNIPVNVPNEFSLTDSKEVSITNSTISHKIMPLGDSITAGVPDGGGYRIKLWKTAQENLLYWVIREGFFFFV